MQNRADGLVIYVIAEIMHGLHLSRANEIWTLLSELYASNSRLCEFTDDRRKAYAAELLILAWKTTEARLNSDQTRPGPSMMISKPLFLHRLEQLLSSRDMNVPGISVLKEEDATIMSGDTSQRWLNHDAEGSKPAGGMVQAPDPFDGQGLGIFDMSAALDFDPNDIDWSFWEHRE